MSANPEEGIGLIIIILWRIALAVCLFHFAVKYW
jgi:hypothetical protein